MPLHKHQGFAGAKGQKRCVRASGSTAVMERGFAKDVVAGERSVAKGTAMKKIYERPTLVKQGRLTSVTAQIVASGIILGQ
jgi:hypothetical protein